MHDGYLFTLGICGTASDASPAPALLDAMLAALPPVKRAALLGDVRPFLLADDLDFATDTLVDAVAADAADAELLLIVTPLLPGGSLPPRLMALLERMATQTIESLAASKLVALVAVAPAAHTEVATHAIGRVAALFRQASFSVLPPLLVPFETDSLEPQVSQAAIDLAHSGYSRSSETLRARGITHLR